MLVDSWHCRSGALKVCFVKQSLFHYFKFCVVWGIGHKGSCTVPDGMNDNWYNHVHQLVWCIGSFPVALCYKLELWRLRSEFVLEIFQLWIWGWTIWSWDVLWTFEDLLHCGTKWQIHMMSLLVQLYGGEQHALLFFCHFVVFTWCSSIPAWTHIRWICCLFSLDERFEVIFSLVS